MDVTQKCVLFGQTVADDLVEAYCAVDQSNEAPARKFDEEITRAGRLLGGAAGGVELSIERLRTYGDRDRGLGFARTKGDAPADTGVSNETSNRVAVCPNPTTHWGMLHEVATANEYLVE